MIKKCNESQSMKSKIFSLHSNLLRKPLRAQEEMVGFALIIIIVAVVLLVFLSFSLRNSQKETVESYEVESFIQAVLQYTTNCEGDLEYLSVQKLVFECESGGICRDGKDSCEVLKETLNGILEESWKVGEEWPYKGYELKIDSEEKSILLIEKGDKTRNSKSALQDFSKSGTSIDVLFTAYY